MVRPAINTDTPESSTSKTVISFECRNSDRFRRAPWATEGLIWIMWAGLVMAFGFRYGVGMHGLLPLAAMLMVAYLVNTGIMKWSNLRLWWPRLRDTIVVYNHDELLDKAPTPWNAQRGTTYEVTHKCNVAFPSWRSLGVELLMGVAAIGIMVAIPDAVLAILFILVVPIMVTCDRSRKRIEAYTWAIANVKPTQFDGEGPLRTHIMSLRAGQAR